RRQQLGAEAAFAARQVNLLRQFMRCDIDTGAVEQDCQRGWSAVMYLLRVKWRIGEFVSPGQLGESPGIQLFVLKRAAATAGNDGDRQQQPTHQRLAGFFTKGKTSVRPSKSVTSRTRKINTAAPTTSPPAGMLLILSANPWTSASVNRFIRDKACSGSRPWLTSCF